jgi:hypothetical protein
MKLMAMVLAVGIALLGQAIPASASTIGVAYSGVVTSVDPWGASLFNTTNTFTFNILVDAAAADTESADPLYGAYAAVQHFDGSFNNGYTFTSTKPGTLDVLNNVIGGDGVVFSSNDFSGWIGDYLLISAQIYISDPTAAMLGNDAIPGNLASLLSLSKSANGTLLFFGTGRPFQVNFNITSATALATTPIPAALLLFGSALVGLGLVGWRRRVA